MDNNATFIRKKIGLKVLIIISSIAMIVYILWRAIYTVPDYKTYGWVTFIAGLCLLFAEFMSMVETLINYKELSNYELPEMPQVSEGFFPDVDVFIATHNEETSVLFKTVNACTRMKYPDLTKVHIYICDDTKRDEVRDLAQNMGVGYFGISDNKDMKAGNLNNAIRKTTSPLIVTFDADMIPNSEFLMETVPYFALPIMKKDEDGNWVKKSEDEIDEKEKIGFVQTPQTFYNPDLFQYNLYSEDRIPNEQDYFFRHVNSGKNATNSPIYAGSNTVISREALEEVGGIVTGTITEDFETGLKIEMKGYTCIAIDKPLAKGLAPITIKALIKQRERWARGCIYSLRRIHLILNKNISIDQKLSYGACRIYWGTFTRRFIYILAPLLYVLLDIPVVVCDIKGLLLVWLPTNILHAITLRKVSGNIRNTRWSNTIDTILFPHLLIPIWCEALFIKKKKFEVTSKSRQNESENTFFLALPHLMLLILSVIALFGAVTMLVTYNSTGTLIVIYWLIVNIFSLTMSVFFMVGRKNERMTERFMCNIPVKAYYKENEYEGKVIDISEGGFAFDVSKAIYLPHGKGETVDFVISNKDYRASLKGNIVSVREINRGKKWRYCIQVAHIDEENTKEYLQLIYDRVHTLPMTLSRKTSYFEDIENNVAKRMSERVISKRRLPRISMNKTYDTTDEYPVKIVNYNFECVRLDSKYSKELTIVLSDTCKLKCLRMDNDGKNYKIVNNDELEANEEFHKIVDGWVEVKGNGEER